METAAREFQIMVKTVGAICNLDCDYCYYLKKEDLYPKGTSFRLSDETLERYIAQHIRATPKEIVSFSWHGGEPTLLGVDFFRKAVALQKKYLSPGKQLVNGIQTNGTLIDEEWCRFLAAENFYVGLSLDGPRDLHDRYRLTKGRKPTHRAVVQAFQLLRQHEIHVDLLCVVHEANVRHPIAVYRFLKEIGGQYLQFLPLVEKTADPMAPVHPRSVPADAYGDFLCAVFDEWVRNDIGRVFIQLFDEAVRPFLGMEHALCIFRETCGDVPVVEHNGDFYSCDHYVEPAHKIGNIYERTLAELIEDPAQREFGRRKWTALPRYCRECEVRDMCNGGCPKDRLIRTPDGEEGLNYLCAGLKRFFTHSKPYFQEFARLVEAGEPAEKLMEIVRARDARRPGAGAGRNDPCPCGSGRKYKRCCGGAAKASAAR
ncbi:MAG TPA: anaerobic sulfatase maturase [candidate division Zixibacteria bacterium]|nr:anaerobic sulfatase maturase [candidate division Zixibacteria bacterium]